MPTAKATTYRARTHRLRGGAKKQAAKSAKARSTTKKKPETKLTPRIQDFIRLAKKHKEREFFEALTDAELDTFVKALKIKQSDSREKKLNRVITYSKANKSALLVVFSGMIGIYLTGTAASFAYAFYLERQLKKDSQEAPPHELGVDEKGNQFQCPQLGTIQSKKGPNPKLLKLCGLLWGASTGLQLYACIEVYNKFKRFHKALQALPPRVEDPM